jgi:hypothetical protein
MYYWYYGTLAMSLYGGQERGKWNEALKDAVIDSQRTAGCARGSWDPVGKWCIIGGRVYSTAVCVLALQATREPKEAADTKHRE